MRRILRASGTVLAIVVAMAITLTVPALALAGYLPFGGYDRGGYEYSALFGYVPIGGYERGGYEYSALFGHVPFGDYDRGGYEFSGQ